MAAWTTEALWHYVAELEARSSIDSNPIQVLLLKDAIADAEAVLAGRTGPLL